MRKITNKIKAVIFDMDGTIVDTEHAWYQATQDVLAARGFTRFNDKQKEVLVSMSGIGLLRSAEVLKKEFQLDDSVKELAEDTRRKAHELFEGSLQFIDGFEAFHKKLQTLFMPTSIATNADKASLNRLSKKMKLERFFGSNLYSIETVGNKAKPKPDIFLHAAQQLNVAPNECIVFEDSIFGFQAAQAAGMKCIAIKNKINKDNLQLVDDAIESYHEAEQALLQLIK